MRGELTTVSATPGSVTTLLRDTQADEFAAVFRYPAYTERRSDTFTPQPVTTLLRSTFSRGSLAASVGILLLRLSPRLVQLADRAAPLGAGR